MFRRPVARSFALSLSCGLGAQACAQEEPPEPTPARIVVDSWETVVDQATFPDGVQRIYIGGQGWQDNFVNRGQVEVRYEAPPGTISVELRRFAAAISEEAAQDEFAATHLWAYSVDPPQVPAPALDADACSQVWRDECRVRIWFDGMVQPRRVGADIRVIVPPGWEGRLEIVTEDTEGFDEGPPRRSDVSVVDLAGSANAELGSGAMRVRLDRNIEVAPECSPEENEACAQAGWTPDCGCVDFGRLQLRANGSHGAEALVDAPADLWIDTCLENGAAGEVSASCSGTVECDTFDDCTLNSHPGPTPWKIAGHVNPPGAVDGGYAIVVESDACSFEDGVPVGDQVLCSGCLGDL